MRSRLLIPALALVAGSGSVLATTAAVSGAVAATASSHTASSPRTTTNHCWPKENGAPVVDSFDVSPSTVDTTDGSATVSLTVAAHDTGGPGPASGVAEVGVTLRPGSGPLTSASLDLNARLTLENDGLWHGSVTAPQGSLGTVRAYVGAVDTAAAKAEHASGGSGYSSRHHFGQRVFADALQVTDADPDTTPPTISDLTFGTTSVNTTKKIRTVQVDATVTDTGSGVHKVYVELEPPGTGRPDQRVVLTRVGDTDDFLGQATFLRWTGDHTEGINITAVDKTGNAGALRSRQLEKRGLPSVMTVASGPLDAHGPRIQILTAPHRLATHATGSWYNGRVRVSDPQGIAFVRTTIVDTGLPAVHLRQVSGTLHHGVFVIQRWVSCVPSPQTTKLRLIAVDTHGRGTLRTVPLKLISPDHVAPTARSSWRTTPHVFRFSEPVHGISSDNVQVYDTDTSTGLNPLAGDWACRNAKGRTVDCLTGSVLSATFTPADPDGVPGVVDWEPEHHLDVLDANGNPFASESVSPDVSD